LAFHLRCGLNLLIKLHINKTIKNYNFVNVR
jgi:hypothetical protein